VNRAAIRQEAHGSLEEAGRARPAEEADKLVLVVEEKKKGAAC
jgi:hypothetical protein